MMMNKDARREEEKTKGEKYFWYLMRSERREEKKDEQIFFIIRKAIHVWRIPRTAVCSSSSPPPPRFHTSEIFCERERICLFTVIEWWFGYCIE